MIKEILYYLAVPGLLYTASIGLFSSWVDRKVTARIQYRRGPVWFQPFADIVKLLGKEVIVPEGSNITAFMSAPFIGFTAVLLVSAMLWSFNINKGSTFIGDLIVVIYLLVIPSLSMMIGGSASRNPFGALGASREMKLMLAYELPFLISIASVIATTGTIMLGNIIEYQSAHGMLVSSVSGAIAFVVCILVIQAKLGFNPFDIAEADQEIMGGTMVEYSGGLLAMFRLMKSMLLFALPMLLITLFLGGGDLSSGAGIMWFIIKYAGVLTLLILIKNTNPRLRVDQAVRFFWGPVTILAVIGLVLSLMRLQ